MEMLPLYHHQKTDIEFLKGIPHALNLSDPGTGKTRTSIEVIRARKHEGRTLIICPKSIMQPAWGNDLDKFAPELSYSIATATNRAKAFNAQTDIVITNHDAVLWIQKCLDKRIPILNGFTQLVIDECFPGNTPIATPSGPRHIKVIECGEPVYTSLGTALVSKKYTKVTNELVRLHLSNGNTVTCTPNHPFATEKGWVAARDLGSLRVVLHNLHKLATSPVILQPNLLQESDVGEKRPSNPSGDSEKISEETNRPPCMEHRNSLRRGNQRKIAYSTPSIRALSENTWWKRETELPRRTNARNTAANMASTTRHTHQTKTWFGIPHLLQSGLRLAREKMGLGNRWKLARIAKATRREKRYLSETVRVDRVENIQLPRPITVYNLEVEGSHDYFANGVLVHNCTAFKNISQRTKAVISFKNAFKYRLLLTGTVYTNSLTDIWRQALICDDGKRLGNSFFRFRNQVCTGRTLGNGITVWEDKPGMEPIIYELLKDITIRHKLEDCVEIPENATSTVHFELNKAHLKTYTEFESDALLQINDSKVIAINAAVLANKLLQIASGAVYDSDHNYQLLTTDRYELIKDLAEARAQVVIAFHWQHQKDQLLKLLPQAQFIDGSVNNKKRTELIAAFQNKEIPQIIIHPKTGAHGITLTAGTATIWASPTYSSEDFTQLNHRIYRAGQKQKTETLLVTAKGTIEETVYKKLQGKLTNMHSIMSLFAA